MSSGRCQCQYEAENNLPITKRCFIPCREQKPTASNYLEEISKKWEASRKAPMSREEIIQALSHIENTVKDYRGEKRRYYRMNSSPDDMRSVVEEAASVLFPDMKVEDPEVLHLVIITFGTMIQGKVEIWDGVVWIRTIMI